MIADLIAELGHLVIKVAAESIRAIHDRIRYGPWEVVRSPAYLDATGIDQRLRRAGVRSRVATDRRWGDLLLVRRMHAPEARRRIDAGLRTGGAGT